MAQIPRNMLTMQQNLKENGFTIIKSMRNNTRYSGIFGKPEIMSGKLKS